jgi:hypothetical protein
MSAPCDRRSSLRSDCKDRVASGARTTRLLGVQAPVVYRIAKLREQKQASKMGSRRSLSPRRSTAFVRSGARIYEIWAQVSPCPVPAAPESGPAPGVPMAFATNDQRACYAPVSIATAGFLPSLGGRSRTSMVSGTPASKRSRHIGRNFWGKTRDRTGKRCAGDGQGTLRR